MKKIAIYTGFAAASLAEAAIFVTTTTYIQLVIAALLYLPLTYFAFKLFPRITRFETPAIQKDIIINRTQTNNINSSKVEVLDIDKRAFLKLIGATGISFFISSLFTKRVGSILLGKGEEPGPTTIQDTTGNIINPAQQQPTDNYNISEVEYGIITYYGFIDSGEGWFIMKEDVNDGTYRYTKGSTNFRDNWNNRENLKYDYFNHVFPKS